MRRVKHWQQVRSAVQQQVLPIVAGTLLQQVAVIGAAVPLASLVLPLPAEAAMLTNWVFDPSTQQLEVTVPAGATPRYFLLAQPARIVLDFPNTQVGAVPAQQTYSGAVRQIRVGQFDAELTRIVIELSPDAVLAPEQVELRQAAQASENRWVLRPLLASASIADRPLPADSPDPATGSTPATPMPDPISEEPAALPPLEPNALEIPIAPSTAPAASIAAAEPEPVTAVLPAPTPVTPPTSELPALPANAAIDPAPAPAEAIEPPTASPSPPAQPSAILPAEPPAQVAVQPELPTLLPPARPQIQPPATVTVPPLQPTPPAPAPAQAAPSVTVPPLASPPATSRQNIEFGQPLPSTPPAIARASTDALLAQGSVLSLRYPRDTVLELEADTSRQEVLLLQEAVRDAAGNVLIPVGSEVIGRFETDSSGSRFFTQAISLQGRNLRIQAESEPLSGDRDLIEDDLLGNSAIGALALGVLGGFSGVGLLGGALAGAATTYLTAPQPATIQPNQVLQVRLLEDFLPVR